MNIQNSEKDGDFATNLFLKETTLSHLISSKDVDMSKCVQSQSQGLVVGGGNVVTATLVIKVTQHQGISFQGRQLFSLPQQLLQGLLGYQLKF
ncbi:hypothetical protein DPMN_083581 [Dreissena polymorpha]|uniref:Uncharacterized protein n=1 Tax=Dreissena polymorpha TaxID=45954 RepID=A0A9D3Y912_DREPO|nr:hypothetical protein DPMN_083581 [Dreissena polymorpha]